MSPTGGFYVVLEESHKELNGEEASQKRRAKNRGSLYMSPLKREVLKNPMGQVSRICSKLVRDISQRGNTTMMILMLTFFSMIGVFASASRMSRASASQ